MTSIETALRETLDALDPDLVDGHREAQAAISAALDALRTADTATAHARISEALAVLDGIV